MSLYEEWKASGKTEAEYFRDVLAPGINKEYAMRVLQKAHKASVAVGNKKKEE